MTVTDDIVAEYNEEGYWIGPKLFNKKEVEELRREVMRILRGEKDFDCVHPFPARFDLESKSLMQATNSWWVNARIRKLLAHPTIGHIAERLMDTQEARLFHDQILYKPGLGMKRGGADGDGSPSGSQEEVSVSQDGNVGWHQDAPHWTYINSPCHVTAWIALQDTDVEGGCMQFIPGSNKWGFCKDAVTFYAKDMEGLKERFTKDEGRVWKEAPCILEAGQVSFHSGLTFHGSGPNYKKEPRLSIVLNMIAKGAYYDTNGSHPFAVHLGPNVKHGDIVGDPHYPRIGVPSKS